MRLLLVLGIAASLLAEDDPRFGKYHDYAELTAILSKLTDEHPDLVSVTPLAETRGGRKVWAVEVADRTAGDPSQRPAICVLGGLTGTQPAGSEVALALLLRLIESTDEATVAARRSCTFYVLPRVHPDGVEDRRSGTVSPCDDDHDGLVDEDPPADVDGDGAIVLMRKRDPAGEWLIDEVDARAMRKADASRGERGHYTLYAAEGLDVDGDGRIAEDDVGGVLLDRNFPIHWQARPDPAGAGWGAVCEPETRAVADFFLAHRNIDVAVHYAGTGNLLYWPPAWREEREVPGEDVAILHRLAEEYSKTTGLDARRVRRDAPPLGRPTGTWLDWAYEGRGVYAFEACLWDLPEADVPAEAKTKAETKDAEGRLDDALKRERMWLAWTDAKSGGRGFVPWHAVKHPTLGEVEIGGWRAGVREEPPAEVLAGLSEKQLPWLVQAAGHLPRVELVGAESRALGAGSVSVRVRVRNGGYLPTASWQARRAEEAGPVVVELAGEGVEATMGQARRVLKPLAGGETSDWIEWVVKAGPREAIVRAWTPRAGSAETRIRLGE